MKTREVLRTGIFGSVSAGSTVFLDPNYLTNPLDNLGFVVIEPGVLHGLHVLAKTPPTDPGASDVYTVFVNGIATSLTVTMTGTETCVIDADHFVSVAPCDRVSVRLVASTVTLAADVMVAIKVVDKT